VWNAASRQSDKKLVNLTHMWKAEGSPKSKEPWHWNELPSAK